MRFRILLDFDKEVLVGVFNSSVDEAAGREDVAHDDEEHERLEMVFAGQGSKQRREFRTTESRRQLMNNQDWIR